MDPLGYAKIATTTVTWVNLRSSDFIEPWFFQISLQLTPSFRKVESPRWMAPHALKPKVGGTAVPLRPLHLLNVSLHSQA